MIDYIKQDRISQLIIAVGLLVVCFSCAGTGWIGYKYLSRKYTVAPMPTSTEQFYSPIGDNLIVKNARTEITASHFKVWGQVENVGAYTCVFPEIVVEYYDHSDTFIISKSGYLEYRNLAPGETSPFSIITRRPDGLPEPARFSLIFTSDIGCMK